MEYLARIAKREGLDNDEREVEMEVDDEMIQNRMKLNRINHCKNNRSRSKNN